MKRFTVINLCRIAILIAVYFLLGVTLVIHTGNFKLTFVALPVILAALLIGTPPALLVALLGEFLTQLLTFGLMPTTFLWVIPPMAWGLVGIAAGYAAKTRRPLEERPVFCYLACIAAGCLTSFLNTMALWLDSLIYDYYAFGFVFGSALLRVPKDIITAVIVATLAIPMARILRRRGLVKISAR